MNHDLAKALKDAGFPQNRTPGQQIAADAAGAVHFPTLEELLAECGAKNLQLTADHFGDWTARSFIHAISADGSTPREAVARLYLAQHPKPLPTSTE